MPSDEDFGSKGISQAAYWQAAPNHQDCGDVAAPLSAINLAREYA